MQLTAQYQVLSKTALQYAEGNGEGHNANEHRNVVVSSVNMIPNGKWTEQMMPYWNKARANHKIQGRRIVQSFSRKEFSPDSEADALKVNLIGLELVKEHYPDRQAVVFTQKDGKSGLLHNHVIISDVAMTDLKSCDKQQYYWKNGQMRLQHDTLNLMQEKQKQPIKLRRQKEQSVKKVSMSLKMT